MENCRTDKNGYIPSIMQTDLDHCYMCGRSNDKLDRHEVFGGCYRQKSKRYGLWVMLCHSTCHQGFYGVHNNPTLAMDLKMEAEEKALEAYGWDKDKFISEFGKNFL